MDPKQIQEALQGAKEARQVREDVAAMVAAFFDEARPEEEQERCMRIAREASVDFVRDRLSPLCSDVEALAQALQDVTAEMDRLKKREHDIINATNPADGGQYRADIAGAIERQRRELNEARARVRELEEQLEAAYPIPHP
jgi:hypothetical protein